MTTELTTMNEDRSVMDLSVSRPPAIVIEEARKAAVALKDVLDKKPNKVMMNNEQYLEFEDWQTVAQFYGCKVKIVESKPVQFGSVMGFEAKAVCFHVATGREVSSAEAMCLNDEEKWNSRNKYEWAYCKKSGGHSVEDPGNDEIIWEDNPKQPGRKRPKKEKIVVSKEPVPLFQLRSMAQTRAGGKAFRNAFAWVVVLAGYKPTPAEELPDAQVIDNSRADEETAMPPTSNRAQTKPAPQNKGAAVLDKMKKGNGNSGAKATETKASDPHKPAETQAQPASCSAPTDTAGIPAEWLSQVLDVEDFLRQTEQGKNTLRSIRAGFNLEGDAYPMDLDHQAEYMETLKRSAMRLGMK